MSTPKLPAINHRQNPSGFQNTPSQNFSERELSKSVSLAAVRAKRKQIDETAHLLNNRVLVLEHEQEKLIKATRDTKEKTSFMLKHRVDREETQRNIREMTRKMKEQLQQSYKEKRQKVLEMQQSHNERDIVRNYQFDLIREQRALNLQRLQENRERYLAENKLKREKVKHMKKIAEQKVDEFFNQRFEHFARERDLMIQEEERLIREKEEVIKALSRKEDKLLNDVDEHQMVVRKAQGEFEDLNQLDTQRFVAKHSEYLSVITPNRNLNKSMQSSKSVTSTNKQQKPLSLGGTSQNDKIPESKREYDDFGFDQAEKQPKKQEESSPVQKDTTEQQEAQQGFFLTKQEEEGEGKKGEEMQNGLNEGQNQKELTIQQNDLNVNNDKPSL